MKDGEKVCRTSHWSGVVEWREGDVGEVCMCGYVVGDNLSGVVDGDIHSDDYLGGEWPLLC